jgi:hypothetical protein
MNETIVVATGPLEVRLVTRERFDTAMLWIS